MVGKLFAIRRDALATIGGFDALVSYLGEDMELARRLSAADLRVLVTATPARSLAQGRSWPEVVRRYARWMAVLRAQRPWFLAGYPLVVASAPLQAALALFAAIRHPLAGAAALGATLAARYGVAVAARVRSSRSLRGLALAPWAADVTLLAALAVAVSSRTVHWRGVALRIDRRNVAAEAKR
jgi:ceramide glucosyltransferase